jgi:hypothetical protein
MISNERLRRSLTIVIVLLGLVCLPYLAWVSISFLTVSLMIAQALMSSLRWGSLASFWGSLINHNILEPPLNLAPIFIAFTILLAVLLWQWIVCLFRRRTLLRPRRLWLVTAIYFVAFTAFLQWFFLGLLNAENVSLSDPTNLVVNWFVYTCAFPVTFIVLSICLWLSTPNAGTVPQDLHSNSQKAPA